MKIFILFLLVVNLFANEKLEFDSKFGIPDKGSILSNFKDSKQALADHLDSLAKKRDGRIEVFYYSNYDDLYKSFKNKKVEMAVFEAAYFFENREKIEKISNNYWTFVNENYRYKQYYLISNKTIKANSFKDIKNKTLSMKDDNSVLELWLDKNSLKYNNASYKKILKSYKLESKESTSILNVYFKRTDFAVVSKRTWDTLLELNPAIKKKIRIVTKSKKIHIPLVGAFLKNANKKMKDAFFYFTKDLKGSAEGSSIISLFKYDTVIKLDKKSLDRLDAYYKEYYNLKNKY